MLAVVGMYVLLLSGNDIITPVYFDDIAQCKKVATSVANSEDTKSKVIVSCVATGIKTAETKE